jgi:tRNA 2-thiouridine synthesizing protein E
MPFILVSGRQVEVDELGFLLDGNSWSEEVAVVLAEHAELEPLVDDHWKVILYVREFYEKHATAPMLRRISKRTRLGEQRVAELFPKACRECMCRVAGLPRPTG